MMIDPRQTILHLRPLCTTVFAMIFLSCTTIQAQDTGSRRTGRLAPPAMISCERNQLTSWTGTVSAYRREEHKTWLEIRTDELTVEQVSIDHDGAADASAQFLLWGEPFTQASWELIEADPGTLVANMRATAWICLDGKTAPVVDWKPLRD